MIRYRFAILLLHGKKLLQRNDVDLRHTKNEYLTGVFEIQAVCLRKLTRVVKTQAFSIPCCPVDYIDPLNCKTREIVHHEHD